MESIYTSTQYADLNPTWHEEDSPWKAKQIIKILEKNGVSFSTACEVGSGTGEILLNLSRHYPKATFTGYEISPHAHQRASMKATDKVAFKLENVTDVRDAYFDLLIIADVIEHVEDYVSFTKSLRDKAKYKIFHIPLDISVQSVFRAWPIANLRKNVGHIHSFFKDSAIATLKDCGYSVIDHAYTASRLELPNQAVSSKLMSIPRRALFSMNQDFAVRVLGGYSLLVLAE